MTAYESQFKDIRVSLKQQDKFEKITKSLHQQMQKPNIKDYEAFTEDKI